MKPHEDAVLLAMIRHRIECGGPLEPIIDRMLEQNHHSGDLDPYSFAHTDGKPRWNGDWINWYRLFDDVKQVAGEIDQRLREMDRWDLATWIPF